MASVAARGLRTKLCVYDQQGRCKFGASCLYLHADASEQNDVLSPVTQKRLKADNLQKLLLCRDFALGRCDKGMQCPYLHVARAPGAESVRQLPRSTMVVKSTHTFNNAKESDEEAETCAGTSTAGHSDGECSVGASASDHVLTAVSSPLVLQRRPSFPKGSPKADAEKQFPPFRLLAPQSQTIASDAARQAEHAAMSTLPECPWLFAELAQKAAEASMKEKARVQTGHSLDLRQLFGECTAQEELDDADLARLNLTAEELAPLSCEERRRRIDDAEAELAWQNAEILFPGVEIGIAMPLVPEGPRQGRPDTHTDAGKDGRSDADSTFKTAHSAAAFESITEETMPMQRGRLSTASPAWTPEAPKERTPLCIRALAFQPMCLTFVARSPPYG